MGQPDLVSVHYDGPLKPKKRRKEKRKKSGRNLLVDKFKKGDTPTEPVDEEQQRVDEDNLYDVDGISHRTGGRWTHKDDSDVSKHMGPGPHPSGSPQSVHGRSRDVPASQIKTFDPPEVITRAVDGWFESHPELADQELDVDWSTYKQDHDFQMKIAKHYDSLPEFDEEARPAFEQFGAEIHEQFVYLTEDVGIEFIAVEEDPYRNVLEAAADLGANGRLKILATEATGGHPMISDEINDEFRFVHDIFGHIATGRNFDRHGEEAAFLHHASMFSKEALPAMASETRGQNASLIANREFGPQRAALMEPWAYELNVHDPDEPIGKHYGPSAHPGTGTEQTVHGTGGGGGGDTGGGDGSDIGSPTETPSAASNPGDATSVGGAEESLRPDSFDGFVGQEDLVTQLKIMMSSAKQRGATLDHVLLSGPPGLGKTTLARIVANEMGGELHVITGPAIRNSQDLMTKLASLQDGDMLFIDEIHALPRNVQEILYPAMEDFEVDVKLGDDPPFRLPLNRFTLLGATTRAGDLERPLQDRFGLNGQLDYYKPAELEQLVQGSASKLQMDLTPDATSKLALAGRGTPRVANNLLEWTRDYHWATAKGVGQVTGDTVSEALGMARIDSGGLNVDHREYLRALRELGTAGSKTIAARLGTDPVNLEGDVEPYLVQEGYVIRTPRGRAITPKGEQHLDGLDEFFKFYKHGGPGPHQRTGTPQEVHAGGAPKSIRPGIDDNRDVAELAEVVRHEAERVETQVTPILKSLVAKTGGQLKGLDNRLKTEHSLRRKIVQDSLQLGIGLEEAAANIRDATRYTVTWEADDQFFAKADTLLDEFEAEGWTVFDHKDKNFFAPGDHYGGVNTQLTNGDDFIEVQLHTPASFEIKDKAHKILDQLRTDLTSDEREVSLKKMFSLWNDDLSYIPPGYKTWGTESRVIAKGVQIAKDGSQYWIFSYDGEDPDGLFRFAGSWVQRYDFKKSKWEESTYTIPDVEGHGGRTDFLRVSDKYAIDLVGRGLPEPAEFSADVQVAKTDEYENRIFGWASVAFSKDGTQILDRQGHSIDVEDLESMAYNFTINHRKTGDMHNSDDFGEMIESMVFTPEKVEALGLEPGSIPQGWWVGFEVPSEYHRQVREGKRSMFSIEGTARLEPYTD